MSELYIEHPIHTANPAVRTEAALELLWYVVTVNSKGPPIEGATVQDDESGMLTWSAILGLYLGDENGNQLVDESGNYLLG